jgi:hypothetical protein
LKNFLKDERSKDQELDPDYCYCYFSPLLNQRFNHKRRISKKQKDSKKQSNQNAMKCEEGEKMNRITFNLYHAEAEQDSLALIPSKNVSAMENAMDEA